MTEATVAEATTEVTENPAPDYPHKTASKKLTVKHPEFGEKEVTVNIRVPILVADEPNVYSAFERYFGGQQDFVEYVIERILNGGANNTRAAITKGIEGAKTLEAWEKVVRDALITASNYTVRTGLGASTLREAGENARKLLSGKSVEEIQNNPELILQALAALKLG